jgi:hypothetical protein
VLIATPALSTWPSACPSVVVTGSRVSYGLELGLLDKTNRVFGVELFLGSDFDPGNYLADMTATVGGQPWSSQVAFTVIAGGDSGGSVISLFGIQRPEASYVLAQLSSGRLVQGKNPSV